MFIKAFIGINLKDTISDGIMAKDNKNEYFWVELKYEKLGQVCYHYGSFHHEEEGCALGIEDESDNMKNVTS